MQPHYRSFVSKKVLTVLDNVRLMQSRIDDLKVAIVLFRSDTESAKLIPLLWSEICRLHIKIEDELSKLEQKDVSEINN